MHGVSVKPQCERYTSCRYAYSMCTDLGGALNDGLDAALGGAFCAALGSALDAGLSAALDAAYCFFVCGNEYAAPCIT